MDDDAFERIRKGNAKLSPSLWFVICGLYVFGMIFAMAIPLWLTSQCETHCPPLFWQYDEVHTCCQSPPARY